MRELREDVCLRAKTFDDQNFDIETHLSLGTEEVFRSDADADIVADTNRLAGRYGVVEATTALQFEVHRVVMDGGYRGQQEVHLRRADESCYKEIVGTLIEIERTANLLDATGVEDDDLVRE